MDTELVRVVGSLLDVTQVADASLQAARARGWLFREKQTWGVGGLDMYLGPMSRELPGFELAIAAHIVEATEDGEPDDDGVLSQVLFVVSDGLNIVNDQYDELSEDALIARRLARDSQHAQVLLGLFESGHHEVAARTPQLTIRKPEDPPPSLRTPAVRGGVLNIEFDLD